MVANLIPPSARRWLAGAGLVSVVLVGHVAVTDLLARHALNFMAAEAMPARIEVIYVREMALAAPPAAAAAAVPVARRRVPHAIAPAASQPAATVAAAEQPEPPAPVEALSEPEPEAPTALAEAATPQPAASEAAAAAAPFEWPVSTRMRYVLTGYFRGELNGQAQVEWIRAGNRYQVHLDVEVGLLASRRMSSDGDITPEGLAPRRYDQETKLAFNEPQRAVVRFENDQVLLATGQAIPRWPGVQDTVSQFVQLSWMFASQPDRLRVGNAVEIALAMPRNVSSWVYDVLEEETLYTNFGEVQAFHLKPRREPRAGGDMTTEIWIAPRLRYLPVRFRIHPDPEAYFDLVLDRRPELAAPDSVTKPQ
ncbi:MAG: DUF3108 domain-containing protein [Rhizobacter sp.]